MVSADQIERKLKESLPSATIKVHDMTGGGDHWQLQIRASEFRGKSMVEQHRMVYAALGTWMEKEIHALALDTDEA
jgi:stress-induced morphogen